MDSNNLRQIIRQYKLYFKDIHKEGIYKWRAVKCFQNNWDIQATDFFKMLNASFSLAYKLLPESKCAVISEISNASKMERITRKLNEIGQLRNAVILLLVITMMMQVLKQQKWVKEIKNLYLIKYHLII